MRLKRIGEGPPTKTSELSFGLNVTTGCLDAQLPFSLATRSGDPRAARAERARRDPAGDVHAVVDRRRARHELRRRLPAVAARRSPAARRGRPARRPRRCCSSGRLDMRTPLEDALRVKAQLPRSQIVVVPGNGHDQVDTDGTGCVAKALTRYTARKPVGQPCAGKSNQVMPLPRAPLSLSRVPHAGADPGPARAHAARGPATRSRTRASAGSRPSTAASPRAAAGCAAAASTRPTRSTAQMTLRDYSYVPGVRVSGTLAVDGSKVRGRVTVTRARAPARSTCARRRPRRACSVAAASGSPAPRGARWPAPAPPRAASRRSRAALLQPSAVQRRPRP